MSIESDLSQRLTGEFDRSAQRARTAQESRRAEEQELQQRLARFNEVCDGLHATWGPRIEEFSKQLGQRIKVTPSIRPALREITVDFLTEMANVTLVFSVAPSADVSKLVLDYELRIVPVLFEYDRHARLELPLDQIDPAAIGTWMDDRLVSCVKTYLSMQENDLYVRRIKVEDPVSKARILPENAVGKVDHGGQTYYFSSEESLNLFKNQHPLAT